MARYPRALVGLLTASVATLALALGPACATPAGKPADAAPILAAQATPQGTLVIAGGGSLPPAIFEAFVRAAGGRGATVAILPVASGVPEESVAALRPVFAALGAKVTVIDLQSRADAARADRLAQAAAASGFWLTGGDQNRTGDKLVGTPLHQAMMTRYHQGAVIGGTSAGAAAMSRTMLTGEGNLEETAPGSFKTREGLGFLPGCLVDQHFLRRSRHNRLLSWVQSQPDHLGLGIDEETALVVHQGKAQVIGNRRVLVIDPRRAAVGGGTAQGLNVHLLGPGQRVELSSGKVSGALSLR